jgi:Uncharacterised nucleotidyltransferase
MTLQRAIDKSSIGELSPELGLLLGTARTHMDTTTADRIKGLLRGEIDWESLLSLAGPHGLTSLLYWQLNAICPQDVPEDRLSQLRNHFEENTRHNLYLTGEMLKVIGLLEREGIKAVPFRGPVLASSCYGHLGLREFGDLDLLIHRGDSSKAEALLREEGYQPLIELSTAQREALERRRNHLHLMRPSDDTRVELHWDVLPKYLFPGFDGERLWSRLEEVSVGGTAVSTFSGEDLLLILCLHEAAHAWLRLGWICDTSELIRVYKDLDWEEVVRRARAARAERVLLVGLFLAQDLLGAPLSDEIIEAAMSDSANQTIAIEIERRIFENVAGSPLALIRTTDNMSDRIGLSLRIARHSVAPTPAEWEVVSLPPALSFIYWIIRPILLTWKYGLRPLKSRISSVLKRK